MTPTFCLQTNRPVKLTPKTKLEYSNCSVNWRHRGERSSSSRTVRPLRQKRIACCTLPMGGLSMPKPLVHAEIISRIFGVGDTAATALQHASFRIEEGEVIALSGPSGSGKSTLLHLIGALDAPTDGTISWPGLGAIGTLRPAKVVNVFQGPSLLPPISVIDNVALPMLLAEIQPEEADARALTALTLLRIGHLTN